MVLFLIADVVSKGSVVRSADGECTVPVLPFEILPVREGLVNPSGRVALNSPNKICDRDCGWWFHIQMHMVSDSAGGKKAATLARNYRCGAGKQPRPPFGIEPWPPILGSPHEMNPKREVRIRH
jgi:hypothetical protein